MIMSKLIVSTYPTHMKYQGITTLLSAITGFSTALKHGYMPLDVTIENATLHFFASKAVR